LIADDHRRVAGVTILPCAQSEPSITSSRRFPDDDLYERFMCRATTDVVLEVTDVKVE
jgi:hypothetical protein